MGQIVSSPIVYCIESMRIFIHLLKIKRIMSTKKNKTSMYFYIITIAGCVLACSSIIPNDYVKLIIVMGALGVGLFGIMKGLSTPPSTEETPNEESKQ